jgi:hypothetical protein
MTFNQPASHNPARWRTKTAVLAAALALATIPVLAASASPAATSSGRPTVHDRQALSQGIPIAVGNVHTTVTATPGPATSNYLVNPSLLPPCCVVIQLVTLKRHGLRIADRRFILRPQTCVLRVITRLGAGQRYPADRAALVKTHLRTCG